jgi:hypothetical protein
MTDMPDFDSMSPEEMMKWMESLAKRQGATEGLTTAADMDVAEVAADDERLAGKSDYVPYGWTEEKWKEHLAKEEADKKAKQASAPPPEPQPAKATPPPVPEPEPEPVAAAASADAGDMPDFDSMSPEEMMKWMESLAKRQGATEGLTTSADMEVAQISADDERLAGKGDYVPYGWTEEKWKEHLAKEEAAKSAKQEAAAHNPPPEAVEEELEAAFEEEYDEELETALEGDVLAAPSLDDLFAGANIIEEDEEEFEEEYEEYEEAEPALDMPSFEDLFADSADNEIPDLDLSALESLGDIGGAGDDPMAWLAGLSSGDEEGVPDIDMDALSGLADLGADEPAAESSPMDWLAGLADDGGDIEEADAQEGSLEWLESLARQEGANTEELVTSANLDIPMPDDILDDGPGYEDFSFEQGSGMIAEDENEEIVPSFDVTSMDMNDPENWLDQLAQAQSGTAPLGFGDDEDEDEDEEDLSQYDDMMVDIQEKINQGTVSPEEIELFFRVSRSKADARTDVPDYLDSEDEEEDIDVVEAPVQAEIPDWLQETMNTVPEAPEAVDETLTPKKTDTAEMMVEKLGLEEADEELEGLPDWLSGDAGDDTGDISLDIFETEAPKKRTSEVSTQEVSVVDTSDTWVQAFQQEASGELVEWYETKSAELEAGGILAARATPEPAAEAAPQPIAAVPAGGLKAASLPLETDLLHGEAMLLPEWLGGEALPATDIGSIEANTVEDMDWLSADDSDALDSDMPDWLKEQVDDTVAPSEDLPAWLAGDDIDIESVEDIPDWLRETMGEEEQAIDFSLDEELVTPAPEPVSAPPAKVEQPTTAITAAPKSPAPVPKVAGAIDVGAAFKSAEEKVSAGDIDGAMLDYESIIRANQALEQVEKAVEKLSKADATKRNAAVFRVLGDVRMRQGKLQEALDTYRRALNML